jgi:hypothetical protein
MLQKRKEATEKEPTTKTDQNLALKPMHEPGGNGA